MSFSNPNLILLGLSSNKLDLFLDCFCYCFIANPGFSSIIDGDVLSQSYCLGIEGATSFGKLRASLEVGFGIRLAEWILR